MDQPQRSAPIPSSVPAPAPDFTSAEHTKITRRITLRLIPLLFTCYVIAYIDRINVGFAKLQLQNVLGVDPSSFGKAYGIGAGLFFVGYFIFEIPSNLILHRIGARIWIARIMIVWGLVSMAFVFIKGLTSFYILRFLLGAAEAGFFPGVILYITYWFPQAERARMIALFAIGAIAAGAIGSPMSGALLEMDGTAGLAGWQWLFLVEGIPAVLLGFIVLCYLPNGPNEAKWLTAEEKKWITSRLVTPVAAYHPQQRSDLRQCFTSPVVWLLCLIYFLRNVASYGYEMWLPTIVKGLTGQGNFVVGLINAIPYLIAGIAMYLVGKHSDKTGERRLHMAASAIAATIGFVIAAKSNNVVLSIAGLALAFAGSKSTIPTFWALSTNFLRGTAAAGGIALINAVGNLGGYFGPKWVGEIQDKTKSTDGGMILLGACYVGVAVLAFLVPKPQETVQKS